MEELARAEQAAAAPSDRLADVIAPLMFYLSLLFLGLLACILVLWIDVPRAIDQAELPNLVSAELQAEPMPVASMLTAEEVVFEERAFWWGLRVAGLLLCLWPFFVAEQVLNLYVSDDVNDFRRKHPYWWVYCLLPPLRLCARHRENRQTMWLPRLGWQVVDRGLKHRLERAFSVPMIWIALLILPVLGLQAIFQNKIADYPALRISLHVSAGLIWFAFATEFIVIASVADKKLAHCKKHWLDLVIVLLPLVSFLRGLRLLRAARIVQAGKLHQLSRLVRVYRLRGVAMRGLRAVLVLEVIHRLLRTTPHKRIAKLEEQYREKQYELEMLRQEIDRLRAHHISENATALLPVEDGGPGL